MSNKKILREIQQQQTVNNFTAELTRARAVTVGTAFNGVTDLMMRGHDGSTLWCHMQPVEVVELIHQLAANIGCHVALKPRNDFSSWRKWKVTEEMYAGEYFPPFAGFVDPHNKSGTELPPPEQQPGMQPAMMARSNENEQTVATQKTVGRKRTKRAATAA